MMHAAFRVETLEESGRNWRQALGTTSSPNLSCVGQRQSGQARAVFSAPTIDLEQARGFGIYLIKAC